MTTTIGLNDGWTFTWTEYAGARARPSEIWAGPRFPATVPGDVHVELMREGYLPDLYHGMELDHASWVETKDFWYFKEFPTPAGLEGREAVLVFHGLDTFANVWLNGELLGETENMFVKHEWSVTGKLRKDGANSLAVRLASPARSIEIDRGHRPFPWIGERVFCRKAQMCFGWDIAPRLMTCGIWRPVELVVFDHGRITDATVRTGEAGRGGAKVTVVAGIEWAGGAGTKAKLSGKLNGVPWEKEVVLEPGLHDCLVEVSVKDAPLWWPIGYGDPALCPLEVSLEVGGRKIGEIQREVGIRKIELIQEVQTDKTRSFHFRCNGRDIFITGLNWTPLDAIFARVTPQKITRTLESLARIGCNMLRVWGGGIYEGNHFYSECDRLGIMIWQDFMMACAWYPQTDSFAAKLVEEARAAVREIRHHACLAVWAGDNENDSFYPKLVSKNRLTRQFLPPVVADLDPGTPYVPSSPYSPSGADPNSPNEGDVHCYIHGQSYREPSFWNMKPRFLSEFGHLSLPSIELIREYFPAGTEWPLTSPMWTYHGADTIRIRHFRGPDRILKTLQAMGRPAPRGIEEAVTVSQELQSEAVTAWIERFSEDPGFAGFMLWNVSDCWPQHSDSVLDYSGRPKIIFERLGPLFKKVRENWDRRRSDKT